MPGVTDTSVGWAQYATFTEAMLDANCFAAVYVHDAKWFVLYFLERDHLPGDSYHISPCCLCFESLLGGSDVPPKFGTNRVILNTSEKYLRITVQSSSRRPEAHRGIGV